LDLLSENLACLFSVYTSIGRQAHSKGAYIAGDEYIFEGSQRNAPGKLNAGFVDLNDFVLQSMGSQLKAVGAKGVALDDLGAGFDVGAVNLANHSRCSQVQGVKALLKAGTMGVEHGAHCPVSEDRGGGFSQKGQEFCLGHPVYTSEWGGVRVSLFIEEYFTLYSPVMTK
jgi:hypothetical protein